MSPESLIASSKVAAVVSDPRQPDNPIVACNEAFMQLTGYPKEEILGRNCRFLRGERTEPQQTAMLREAVAESRPVMVELINYKKDGTAFRNAVMIAPLFDEKGELTYFWDRRWRSTTAGPVATSRPVLWWKGLVAASARSWRRWRRAD